jgi:hypothetical protein
MLPIEYVRDSYARFAPAKPYDVALAAAIAVTFSVLTLST